MPARVQYPFITGMRIYGYPVDLPAASDAPSPRLLRLHRALADENRLRILRFLAGGRHTFTEVYGHLGLTRSTVYHHLVTLRTAGLIRIYDAPGYHKAYSLREGALLQAGAELHRYLTDDQ